MHSKQIRASKPRPTQSRVGAKMSSRAELWASHCPLVLGRKRERTKGHHGHFLASGSLQSVLGIVMFCLGYSLTLNSSSGKRKVTRFIVPIVPIRN